MSSTTSTTRIVILGGGFAGVHTAMFLERRMTAAERRNTEISIVSNENYMVFQPLLPEVISGTIEILHCITPIRRMARRSRLYTRVIEAIDTEQRTVRLAPGFTPQTLELPYDQLVVCLGTQLDFDRVPGMREHAVPFRYLGDALRLRNHAVRVLEEANICTDPDEKRKLLTFVVGGGGFSGVECVAELHDFLCRAVRAYGHLKRDEIRCILVQSAGRILPELSEGLAHYATRILIGRGIEVRLDTRLIAVSADAAVMRDKQGGPEETIATRTIVATVPARPNPLVDSLPVEHDGGRITVTPFLDVPDHPGLWALGDCAAVPQKDGIFSPPTAQHALRQASTCADNMLADMRGKPRTAFGFTGLGSLASLGKGAAVADVMGIRLRGFIAWFAWRGIYLMKFPGWDRRVRIAMDWTLDWILPRDITQLRIFATDPINNEYFHAGETVFADGDFGDKLYVMVSGEADIVKDDKVIATLGSGELFGEMALVSERPRNADVRTRSPVRVLTVSRSAFKKLVAYLPGTRAAVVDIMQSRGINTAALDVEPIAQELPREQRK